jgi:hypothetical protein
MLAEEVGVPDGFFGERRIHRERRRGEQKGSGQEAREGLEVKGHRRLPPENGAYCGSPRIQSHPFKRHRGHRMAIQFGLVAKNGHSMLCPYKGKRVPREKTKS